MITLIDKITREAVGLVESTQGHDMSALEIGPEIPGRPDEWVWDVPSESWVPRPPAVRERAGSALAADTRWQALQQATPEQVETWLASNVTDLASARRVLKILVMAVQRLTER